MARDKKIPMSVHLPADIVAELKTEQLGDSFSNVVADRLRQALKMGPREVAPATPMDDLDMRKKTAEVEMAERRAAILRGEYYRTGLVESAVKRDYAIIKSRLNNIPTALIGATPEQVDDLKKIVGDCMTDLSCLRRDTWDDMQKETVDEFE